MTSIRDDGGRRVDLDFIRVAAIAAVVVIHCIAPIISTSVVDSKSWIAADLIDSFMRWAVPVFVMISGALLIKASSFEQPGLFFRKRFSRLLVPIIVWPILYALWAIYILGNTGLSLNDFLLAYLNGKPLIGYHLYFLFLIAGLYALTPLISAYVSNVSRRHVWVATLTILGVTTLWFTMTQLLPGQASPPNMITQGIPYIGYFMLGYLLKDIAIHRYAVPLATFVIGSLLIALLTYLTYIEPRPKLFFYDYRNILVMIVSPAAFLSLQYIYLILAKAARTFRIQFDAVIHSLSVSSFGIYLIHVFVIQLLAGSLHLNRESVLVNLTLIPATLLLSWALTTIISYVPRVRTLVG